MGKHFLKNKLVKEFGEELVEKLAGKNKDYGALSILIKKLKKMDIASDTIKEFAEKYGRDGLDWLLSKKHLGLSDDLLKKVLKAGNLDDFTDDVLKAIKNSDGYADDIIEQIIKYGDDAAEAIGKYGDDAADAIKRYGDEAIEGFKTGKTPDEITKLTKPTLKKGGKPNGNPAAGSGDGIEAQNNAANILASEGYDITMLDEVDGGNGYGIDPTKNPDYLIDGRVFDCYTPQSNTMPDGVINNIAKKTRNQADRIVLNLESYPADSTKILKKRVQDKINGDLKHLKELIVIINNKVETWFVR